MVVMPDMLSACARQLGVHTLQYLEGGVREFWERHGERVLHIVMWVVVYVAYEVIMKYVG